ncbi:rhodanese-like domain-containing protein 7 [Primulina eburnea]|uniref:rhodanese-like domain-containing protein 7 n=1 Tax=Primulina eburnea TaxID=1245227 RepID=UPI003C6BD8A0
MVPLLRFSLQSHPLLFQRTTSSATAALRMTPSPTSISSLKPNFSIPMAKPTSEITSKSTNFPITKDSTNSLFNSRRLTQSECFSSAPGENPITVSESECVGESVECPLVVVSFYKFAVFPDHANLRMPLKELCERLRVSGGIILAPEGINGSICGIRNSVDEVLAFIKTDDRLKGLRCIESPVSPEEEAIHHGHMSSSPLAAGEDAPFRWDHVRVKLKQEIVTLGMPTVSPMERVGEYVSPKEWNNLISDPDTVVIDVRNDYETRIGKFKQAVDPCTTAFREFPEWVEKRFKSNEPKNQIEPAASDNTMDEQINEMEKNMPRVAMYCTGGIRCEKASSFLLGKGFKEVYHLQGGILKYLEEVPKAESLWEGECFVFDKRVSVEHGLTQGTYKLCYGCKQPVSDADMETPEWEYGVTCPYCYSSKSEEEKERARARQNQFERWGVIGGPDKGRKPTIIGVMEERLTEQMPGSA